MDEQWKYLSSITSPADVKKLSVDELSELAAEIRQKLIQTVSQCGGHLASNLGIVETTIALHRVFDLPHDQIVFDVGHQCYPHKLLTGRVRAFDTLRKRDGLSGFPSPKESPYDVFITGHSSTAISAANGLAKAKSLLGDDGYVVAVVGDGAMSGGLSYEGLSNAGRSHDKLIVLMNDNRMSINGNVGFMARHLSNLRSRPKYVKFKQNFGMKLRRVPLLGKPIFRFLQSMKLGVKNTMYHDSSLFEDMGFYYLGPVDGHNLTDLIRVMNAAKSIHSPVVIHVDTVKGQGYRYAIDSPDDFHGVSGFDIETGALPKGGENFSSVFGSTALALAKEDARVCFITAAMTDGTGLSEVAQTFPKRCFDVGIAEEHAVTFASGLAQNGMLPVFAVYATFLQRSYDQLINDTAIINSHIVLAIDRAGVVPGDGETHQGIFDVPMLNAIPNVTVYAPCCFAELRVHLKQALYDVDGIAAVRYPKGGEWKLPDGYEPDYKPYTWYRSNRSDILLVTYGRLFGNVLAAAKRLAEKGKHVSVLKLNRIKPIDPDCIRIACSYYHVIFFEEAAREGGVAQVFGELLTEHLFARRYEVRAIDRFIPCCTTEEGLQMVGLDVDGMVAAVEGRASNTLTDETPTHTDGLSAAADTLPEGSAFTELLVTEDDTAHPQTNDDTVQQDNEPQEEV